MKVLKLILGVLAALWTLGVVIGFIVTLISGGAKGGVTEIVPGCVAILICGLITFGLFSSALRKEQQDPPPSRSAEGEDADRHT